jgi:hypothetical protein
MRRPHLSNLLGPYRASCPHLAAGAQPTPPRVNPPPPPMLSSCELRHATTILLDWAIPQPHLFATALQGLSDPAGDHRSSNHHRNAVAAASFTLSPSTAFPGELLPSLPCPVPPTCHAGGHCEYLL